MYVRSTAGSRIIDRADPSHALEGTTEVGHLAQLAGSLAHFNQVVDGVLEVLLQSRRSGGALLVLFRVVHLQALAELRLRFIGVLLVVLNVARATCQEQDSNGGQGQKTMGHLEFP